jgi:urease accessory protein
MCRCSSVKSFSAFSRTTCWPRCWSGLGCDVSEVEAPFDPEGGAYGAAAHAHGEAAGRGHDYRPTKGGRVVDPHDPGHGPHRSPAKIHEFK